MMTHILTEPITGPEAWRAADFANDHSWIHHLTQPELDGLDQGLARMKANGATFPKFSREDFVIGPVADLLKRIETELLSGRGFALLRGLPVDRYSEDDIRMIYYGLGLHMGTPVGQNPRGDLLGNVMNIGDPNDKHTRVFETNLYLPYHTDPSDVVGLLCLRKAKTGGLSCLVSAASIFNEILTNHREFLGLLFQPYFYAHLGTTEMQKSQIFSYFDGKLSCRYLRQYIELGHDTVGQPLANVEREALDLFDDIMHRPELRIDMMLEPGDLQFANNYQVLHSRTNFEDHADEALRRKMLRLWIKMPNARKLADEFPGRNGFPVPDEVFA